MEHFHYAVLGLTALALLAAPLRRAGAGFAMTRDVGTLAPAVARAGSVGEAMGRGDNLLLLRAIAATVVIYAHGYALTPARDADLLTPLLGTYAGSVAVYAFFFVSGFLVTGSWQRHPSLGRFLAARALRILPAYALCLLGCALVLGAIATSLPAPDYFEHPTTWRFIGWNLTLPESMVWVLPGTFDAHPHKAINGSLSTLPAEARAYVLLAVFGLLGLLDRFGRLLLAIVVAYVLVMFAGFKVPLVTVPNFVPMLGYFALGMLAWTARGALPLRGWLALLLALLAVASRGTVLHGHVLALAIGYGCLWFAYGPRWPRGFNRFGDYSYGLYLWGFPFQQLALHFMPEASAMQVNLIAWPCALGCAVGSWHLVESPALAPLRGRHGRAAPVSGHGASPVAG